MWICCRLESWTGERAMSATTMSRVSDAELITCTCFPCQKHTPWVSNSSLVTAQDWKRLTSCKPLLCQNMNLNLSTGIYNMTKLLVRKHYRTIIAYASFPSLPSLPRPSSTNWEIDCVSRIDDQSCPLASTICRTLLFLKDDQA